MNSPMYMYDLHDRVCVNEYGSACAFVCVYSCTQAGICAGICMWNYTNGVHQPRSALMCVLLYYYSSQFLYCGEIIPHKFISSLILFLLLFLSVVLITALLAVQASLRYQYSNSFTITLRFKHTLLLLLLQSLRVNARSSRVTQACTCTA